MFVCHVYLMVSTCTEDIPFRTSGRVVSFSLILAARLYMEESMTDGHGTVYGSCYTCLQDGHTYRK